jgi:hypothetical protein
MKPVSDMLIRKYIINKNSGLIKAAVLLSGNTFIPLPASGDRP